MKADKNVKIKYSFVKILTASDLSRRQLPLMSIESTNPGPIIWLTACVHGDEVSGIVMIQEIFKNLRRTLLKGAIHAFPLVNPIGFETSSRYITLSEEDLNRSFPGKKDGTLSERIADQIFGIVTKSKPTLVLDLHNDWIRSIPFVFLDYIENPAYPEAYEKTKIFSKKAGLLPVFDTEEVRGCFSYNLIQKDIPSLTLELGEPYIINEKSVDVGIKSILNILVDLEMIKPSGELFSFPMPELLKDKTLKYIYQNSSASGIIRFLVKPGELVKKGQPVARIYNAFGKLQETITALNDGIVLGHSDYSVSFPGTSIMSFGKF
jgi:predicted deacylase